MQSHTIQTVIRYSINAYIYIIYIYILSFKWKYILYHSNGNIYYIIQMEIVGRVKLTPKWATGWWCSNHLEKMMEFVNEKDDIPYNAHICHLYYGQ